MIAHEKAADVISFASAAYAYERMQLRIECLRRDARFDLQLRRRPYERYDPGWIGRLCLCAAAKRQDGHGRRKRAGQVLGLSHVILHVGFCNAIARVAPQTTIALRVRLADRIGRVQLDRVYRVERGDAAEANVEFDSSFGIYSLDLETPKYRCSAADYLFFMSDHDRNITEKLSDAPAPLPPKPVLLSGTAPQSFLYVQPTFVFFDKSQAICDKPLPPPLPTNISVENDQDAYYASLFADVTAPPDSLQLALRLRTATHQYHYVRIHLPFPIPWAGWPTSIQLNVTEDMIDGLATDPVGTLLCPKMWRTSAG